MRLPRTITLPARNALMALPYCPEPPGPALMSSMRLASTCVPSSPIAVRRISMPLSLVPAMVLRETIRPCASNDTTAVAAILPKMLPLMSPETPRARGRLPPAAGEFAIGDADVAPADAMHEAAPRRQRYPTAVENDA